MAKANPFERSKKDVEPKGLKEGSKREEQLDRKQAKSAPPKAAGKPKAPPFAKGPAAPKMPGMPAFKKGGKVGC